MTDATLLELAEKLEKRAALFDGLAATAPTADDSEVYGEEAALDRAAARALRECDAALGPFTQDGLSDYAGDIADLWLLPENAPVKLLRQSPSLKGWNFDKEIIPEITVADLRRARAARRTP